MIIIVPVSECYRKELSELKYGKPVSDIDDYYSSHFTDEATEAEGGKASHPKAPRE